MTVRAVRNSNPGNINSGAPWLGLQPRERMTPEQAAEKRFAVFSKPMYGFRALAVTLRNYGRMHGLDTARGIISRWAPDSENNTASYVVAVSKAIGVGPEDKLDLTDMATMRQLCKAISIHECGGWMFDDADLDAGVTAALA